ncbi:MAG: phage terminase large subunit [Blastocatellia bacterium]|nr:phage terminase large subunit [Blastocatellia bacterium]
MNDGLPDFQLWLPSTANAWTWTWPHQLLIYEKLRAVTEGRTRRLMIFMPPRHSKSETVTVRYSAWRMIRNQKLNVILGSYNQRLANRFSRKIRRLAEAGAEMSRERKAVDEWETAAGGGLCAVGVGAGVTGYGAGLIVIDDPVKNRAEAESRAFRDSTWDWFNDDIYTRLEPGAAMILIQTRWHEDDLAGRLLKEMGGGGEKWDVLNLPALAEVEARAEFDAMGRGEGEALCPERYNREALLRIKAKIGSYSFSALYQQRPVPRDGGIFKRKWFTRIVERAPVGLRWCRAYDLAVSSKTTADYTASFRCALDEKTGDLYIADGFRARIEFPDQRRYVIARITEEKDTVHAIEKALHGQALVQDLLRDRSLMRKSIRSVRADADKLTRALPWASRAEEGKVVLVRGSWIDEFLEEVCRFPEGRHDDQVDAVSLAVASLAGKGAGAAGF